MASQDEPSQINAVVAALNALTAARQKESEAALFAEQTGASLAQAKAALAAAAQQEASAVAQAAKAKRQADADEAASARKNAADKRRADAEAAAEKRRSDAALAADARKAAADKRRDDAESAAIWRRQAAQDQATMKKWIADQKRAHKEAADAAKAAAADQKSAAQEWKDSGDLMTSPIEAVKKALNGLGPEGQAAAVALAMATAAVTALTAAIMGGMSAAIGVVEKMTQRLSVFSALGGSAAAGKQTLDMVNKLSERLPFSTDQLTQWAQEMQRAGYEGNGLETAVKAVAAAAALNPEKGAQAAQAALAALSGDGQEAAKFLKSMQTEGKAAERKLRDMGLTMADLGGKTAVAKMNASQLQKALESALVSKGKNPLAAMGNTWDVILMKAKAGLMSVFGGLSKAVEPFMGSVKSLFAMFNRGGPVVAILKPIITSVFGTLFSWAKRAVDFVHSAFQQIIIAGLKVRIGIQPIVVAFRQLYAEVQKAIAASGLFQGKSTVLATVLSVLGSILKGTFIFAVTVITGFIRVLAGMAAVATLVITKVRALFKNLNLPNLAAAAGNMIASFISGIGAKIGSVVAAMKAMGQAAKQGLLSALGIASPSKVAIEAAGNVTSSFADKVDDGKPAAQKAFAGMVKAPPAGKGGASGGGAGGLGERGVRALERIADGIEANPGTREALQQALLEAMQEGGL